VVNQGAQSVTAIPHCRGEVRSGEDRVDFHWSQLQFEARHRPWTGKAAEGFLGDDNLAVVDTADVSEAGGSF